MRNALLTALVVVCLGTGVAAARPQGLGLGLMAGEPTGLSAKVWTGGNIAFDAGLGYSYWWHGQALHIHGDVLWHTNSLLQSGDGFLPFYIGVGARVKLADEKHEYPDMRVGIRVPFGLEYVFASVPVGLFLEVVPVIDLAPGTGFSGNSAIGFRYYFGGNARN
ncbi:hypothetical protein JXB37_04410 [candidate division WOR-3 bacterium]|nr:hypothetical protein [candidate division WOR-3 bacterium]